MELGEIYQMNFENLWELFHDEIIKQLDIKSAEDKKDKERIKRNIEIFEAVKDGMKVKYNIDLIINEVNITIKQKQCKILINRKVYELEDFYEEIRYRKLLMRDWIKANLLAERLTNPRSQIKMEESNKN